MVKIISQYTSFTTAEITGSAGEWVLKPGVLVYVDSGAAIHEDNSHADNALLIQGRAVSSVDYGIDSAGASTDITVAATGGVVGNLGGIKTSSANQSITNFGSIDGKTEGIHSQGESLSVDNSSAISGAVGISYLSYGGDILNRFEGIISGTTAIGIDTGENIGEKMRLINRGSIIGSEFAYSSAGTVSDVISNTGLIVGDVHLGAGDDVFRNAGKMRGSVYGGDGSDTYVLDKHAVTIIEDVNDTGTDTVRSSATYKLGKGLENLELTGDLNHDGSGNSAANILTGNDGANTLKGMGDADTLIGGLGKDILTGGTGSDTFVFHTGDGVDRITDFSASLDHLDLSGTAIESLQDLKDNHIEIGDGYITIVAGTDKIILEGIDKAKLTHDNVGF